MVEDGNPLPEDGFTDVPPAPTPPPPDEPPPEPESREEVIPPTRAVLRPVRRGRPGRSRHVAVTLTADALWVQDTWQLRHVALGSVSGIEERRNGKEVALTVGPEASAERLRLTFAGAEEGRRWHDELQARRDDLPPDPPADGRPIPESVTLLKQVPDVAQTVVGRVEFTAATAWLADRGLQLAAALQGADAVVGLVRHKCRDVGPGARHVSGTAVRVEDAADRTRLRRRWFAEEVAALVRPALLLLAIQAALLLLAAVFCARVTGFDPPTGETPLEAVKSLGIGLALGFAWPVVLLALLRVLRWPLLLGSVGLAVLAVTTGRGLAVVLAHLLAVRAAGADLESSKVWYLADPVDWAFIVLGLVLAVRAWRLARRAPHILPPAVGTTPATWRRGLLALTAAYALGLVGFAGYSRYQMSAEMFRPQADWPRVDEAMVAFDEGVDASRREDFAVAERSFLRSARLLEERTGRPGASLDDQFNLGIALYNLGWICQRTGRLDEAERYHQRVVDLAGRLAEFVRPDDSFSRCVNGSRQFLDDVRDERTERLLKEKDRQGVRKCEEAQVKAEKREAGAEACYAEAIALWEDVLAQAKAPEYVRFATARLAAANLMLGDLRQRLGRPREAEDALQKAIEYGEKALQLEPDRPLAKHNLETARRMLDRQREQELLDEINRLVGAERFADAADLWQRRVEEQEELLRAGQDREPTARRLAYRLDRFAWFLAHCPDRRVRDTKAAVRRARRATELQPDSGDYWYTLATAQYRNGDWKDSLASLEQVKAKDGAFGASEWLLAAMNRYQLKQRKEARDAFQKADEWLDERKRQAADDPVLRFQYEMMRPAVESLRREAEDLLNGKDPANQGIG